MANLLPLQEKVQIKKMYRWHLIIVVLIFSFLLIEAGVLMLTPSLFLSFVREKDARERLTIVEQVITAEERKNLREEITEANSKIEVLLGEEFETGIVSTVIARAIKKKNSTIRFDSFFYDGTAETSSKRKFTISGVSQDRQTLLSFVSILREDPLFQEVELPVSNFVKNTDIPFFISFTVNHHATRN